MSVQKLSIKKEHYQAIHTSVGNVMLDGEEVLRVVKSEKIMEFDTDSYAGYIGTDFHNGTITVKVRSRILPEAAELARGFIGIVFRADENHSEFEGYYVRPTNGRNCDDPVRRSHGSQYFAYPGYTFSYFREYGIPNVEAPCDIALDEWITIKAVIHDARGEFYVNNMDKPVLIVEKMKHGTDARGTVGLFVDIGTEGFFKDLTICLDD